MKDDAVYLKHILECIRRIEHDTVGGIAPFISSHTRQDAVLRNLQTLSESTLRLSENLKSRHPETEWRNIGSFRNVLVHDYLGIDLDRIWHIVQKDVPALKKTVEQMLSECSNRENSL